MLVTQYNAAMKRILTIAFFRHDLNDLSLLNRQLIRLLGSKIKHHLRSIILWLGWALGRRRRRRWGRCSLRASRRSTVVIRRDSRNRLRNRSRDSRRLLSCRGQWLGDGLTCGKRLWPCSELRWTTSRSARAQQFALCDGFPSDLLGPGSRFRNGACWFARSGSDSAALVHVVARHGRVLLRLDNGELARLFAIFDPIN